MMADVISGIKIPDSKIAREATELVRQHETAMLNEFMQFQTARP
jgi:hypothetical protein